MVVPQGVVGACSISLSFHFIILLLLAQYRNTSSAASEEACPYNPRGFNYSDALSKSLLFFECQRSGKLPSTQRVTWRGDSALNDGGDCDIDLVGGYYDAGDNVKFGFPLAFTMTVLSWGTLESAGALRALGELDNALAAIKWGTDYLLKASAEPFRLWVQVGNAIADHDCWERPESMDTPRTAIQINTSNPSTEVAAETTAALASTALLFRQFDVNYSSTLLNRAIMLFEFADKYRASNTYECPFYCSYSGYDDELLWAASWLFKATNNSSYIGYIHNALEVWMKDTMEFSWDNKFAGIAVLLSKLYFEGDDSLKVVKDKVNNFICVNLPDNSMTQAARTPGGLIFLRPGANTQYASGVAFLTMVYSSYLTQSNQTTFITCGDKDYSTEELFNFAQMQVDYILGNNPFKMSYMVGFGSTYPLQAHHRGASIQAFGTSSSDGGRFQCSDGFQIWFSRNASNPNLLVGAIVGGPDAHDHFYDVRSNSIQLEPTTYTNALFFGAVSKLIANSC